MLQAPRRAGVGRGRRGAALPRLGPDGKPYMVDGGGKGAPGGRPAAAGGLQRQGCGAGQRRTARALLRASDQPALLKAIP